jgi:adenosylhomocysteine nucleosidase
MTRVAIIAALADELAPLVRGWRRESQGGVGLWRRSHGNAEWIAAFAGIGEDAAARALAGAEHDGPVDAVISTGWAGALREGFDAGSAYGVSAVVCARTRERFAAATPKADCLLVTSDRVAGREEKRRLSEAFGAGLVDMEAAGLARLAARRGIPFHCVKGVSDGPADRMPDLNGFIAPDGRFRVGPFMLFAVLRPWHWPALARLRENGGKSAEGIRESVLGILERDS